MYKTSEGNFNVDKWLIENDTLHYFKSIEVELHQRYLKILLEEAYLHGHLDALNNIGKLAKG